MRALALKDARRHLAEAEATERAATATLNSEYSTDNHDALMRAGNEVLRLRSLVRRLDSPRKAAAQARRRKAEREASRNRIATMPHHPAATILGNSQLFD